MLIEQSGVGSSEREQTSTKPRESAKLKESTKSATPERRGRHSLIMEVALFARDSIELRLV